jgi:hypothetical protein
MQEDNMSKGITLSKEHGVNPCIPVCFWCGEDKNEVALLGKLPGDKAAPMKAVLDFEPCEKCKAFMDQGITLIGVSTKQPETGVPSIGEGLYPTGAWSVIKEESEFCQQLLNAESEERKEAILKSRKCLIDDEVLRSIIAGANMEEEANESDGN